MKTEVALSFFVIIFLSLVLVGTSSGQERSLSQETESYEVDALRCWRRLSTNAPRVGETFEMWITCRIVESEVDRVSSDFVALQAESIEVSPFEVVSGERSRDVIDGIVSFLQFVYRLRLPPGEYFGLDLPLPQLEIMYRIERRVEEGLFIPGRELRHVIPGEPIHILSAVSEGADGLRPLEGETFENASERQFVADGLVILSIFLALFAIGFGIATVVLGFRLRQGERSEKGIKISQRNLFFSLFFELRRIRSEINRNGWSEELVDRVLSSIRVVGTLISEKRISIRDGQAMGRRQSGEMTVKVGIFRNKKCFISASGTNFTSSAESGHPENHIVKDGRSEILTDLLSRFTKVRYAKESEVLPSDLTEILDDVQRFLFRVACHRFSVYQWILKRFNSGVRSL